jgi:tetratricopeptide (TPR) repeat protein
MDILKQLKQFLQEAELYRTQGLLNESESRYEKALELIRSHPQLSSRSNLLEGVTRKMNALKDDINRVTSAPMTPEQSAKVQDLIKKLFAFPTSQDADAAALDGAIALAKFGQFERALEEFETLLDREPVRVPAAKNIFKCHLAIDAVPEAVTRYEQWLKDERFTPPQRIKLRAFLASQLKKQGVETELAAATSTGDLGKSPGTDPKPGKPEKEIPEGVDEEEILDINSIGITMPSGPLEGKLVEFNVSFQSGNVISLLISDKEKNKSDPFEVGDTLQDIQFYSPIAMFNGTGVVSGKTVIESGPRRGYNSLDIKVVST